MKIPVKALGLISAVFLTGCVAGGSSLHAKAKKESGKVVLSLGLRAYGGANLRKYDACQIEFDTGLSKHRKLLTAVVTEREREHVEWLCSIDRADFGKPIYITTKIYQSSGEGIVYGSTWILDRDQLGSSYEGLSPVSMDRDGGKALPR
jgi:hypothetical protein